MTNILKIPTSFQLFGQTIDVEWQSSLAQDRDGQAGQGWFRKNKIVLQLPCDGVQVERTFTEDTFLHELIHFILENIGSGDLGQDEKFVRAFAGLLHQALKTAKYE